MKWSLSLAAILAGVVMASAIAVIYSRHESRKLFIEIQQLRKQIDELNIEWGRMQLEQATWSAHGRIEELARKQLKMRLPDANEVVYIKP